MADSEQETGKGPAAPYTSFPSVRTLLKSLKEHGVPSRIDRSVLTNFSGAVGGQLLTALKFLRLTDGSGHPTERLKSLAASYDSDQWAEALSDVLKEAYAPLFQLNLETASPSQFNEAFKRAYPGADEVQRKSVTFFLGAAKDAQIKVSAYIMRNKKPRTGPPKRRAKNNGTAPKSNSEEAGHDQQPPPPPASEKTISEALLAHFNPTEMEPAQQDAVWVLLKYFKGKGM